MIIIKARPYNVNFSGNGIWYQLYSAAAAADAGISFEVRVMFMRADALVYAVSSPLPLIPSKGKASFNVQSILDAELQFGLPQLVNDVDVNEVASQTGLFYLEFREVSSSSIDPAWDGSEIEYARHVIKGGVPEFQFNNNGFWTTYYPARKPFLTWQLNSRLAAYTERIYLAWYAHPDLALEPGETEFFYKVTIVYTDLTTAELFFDFNVQPNHVYLLPAGGSMLGLNNIYLDKKIWNWMVQVYDIRTPAAPVPVSEQFLYEQDNRPDYNDLQLLYRGSIGGLDTVRIRGVVETSPEYQLQQTGAIRKPYFEDADKVSASFYQLPAQETMNYKGDFGHLKKEEQDRLRDIYLQREIYTVQNKRWLPVNFSIKSFGLRKTIDQLWSLPVEFSLAHDGDFYYAPRNIGFGSEYADTNTCDAIIEDLEFTKEFSVDRLICTITVNFNASSESGKVINKVQYKISTNDMWIDMVYPYTVPLSFNVASGQFITVWVRAICPNSMGGLVTMGVVDAYPPYMPGVDPPPPVANSRVTNNTGYSIIYTVRVNGVVVNSAMVAAGVFVVFNMADATGANIEVQTPGINVGDGTKIVSNANTTFAAIGTNRFYFTSVNIVNGAEIIMI